MRNVQLKFASRRKRALFACIALTFGAGACTEQLATTGTCPTLCPEQTIQTVDLVIQPFSLDTTIVGIPLIGTEPLLLLATSGDTLDVRAVSRFDELHRFVRSSSESTDTVPITEITDVHVDLFVNVDGSLQSGPLTVEVYDIGGDGSDTSAAVLAPRFSPDRLLGQVAVEPVATGDTSAVDTLRVPLSATGVLARIQSEQPLHLGYLLRSQAEGRLQFFPGATRLGYRASPDTAIAAFSIEARSLTPPGDIEFQFDLAEFTLVVDGTAPPPPTPQVLTVGGLPGRRVLLRFDVPSAIIDSSTIVRATLELTQSPVRGHQPLDTVVVLPRPVVAGTSVQGPFRIALLSGNPFEGSNAEVSPLTNLRVSPGDSAVRELEMVQLIRFWRAVGPGSAQRALVLRTELEGSSPLSANFFSSEAPEAVRPRLRLTYIPLVPFGVP